MVVIWGLFHGLVLLPSFLSFIPHFLLEISCYRTIFGNHKLAERNDAKGEEEDGAATELRILHADKAMITSS